MLNVTRSATKQEISKNYRSLAKIHHPDRHQGEEAKKEAEERFKQIATAYEILRDEEARSDYDYMLENPDQYYRHYYRYYRRRVAPKVDVRLVLIVTITLISIIQYFTGQNRYEEAIKYFVTVPKYRNKALEILQNEPKPAKRTGKDRLNKAEQKQELELQIRRVVEEKMDIKGAYAKPTIYDILWIQLLISPYTVVKYIHWNLWWVWKFCILKQDYGTEEKLYLIRRNLGIGKLQFDAIEDHTKEEYLELELWIKDKFKAWKKAQEEEMKKQMAESARYKSYRRYMAKHGPGRMTFED